MCLHARIRSALAASGWSLAPYRPTTQAASLQAAATLLPKWGPACGNCTHSALSAPLQWRYFLACLCARQATCSTHGHTRTTPCACGKRAQGVCLFINAYTPAACTCQPKNPLITAPRLSSHPPGGELAEACCAYTHACALASRRHPCLHHAWEEPESWWGCVPTPNRACGCDVGAG